MNGKKKIGTFLGLFENTPLEHTRNNPQQTHSLWRYFFPFLKVWRCRLLRFLGYVGVFLEQPCVHALLCKKNNGFTPTLRRDDCIDMQLEKSCMRTSLASKHRNSLNLWWYSVYAHINIWPICGCISMLLQLLWMTIEKVMLYIKARRGILGWEVLFMQIHVFSYLKTVNIMSIPQYSIIQHDTTPQVRIFVGSQLINKTVRSSTYQ